MGGQGRERGDLACVHQRGGWGPGVDVAASLCKRLWTLKTLCPPFLPSRDGNWSHHAMRCSQTECSRQPPTVAAYFWHPIPRTRACSWGFCALTQVKIARIYKWLHFALAYRSTFFFPRQPPSLHKTGVLSDVSAPVLYHLSYDSCLS